MKKKNDIINYDSEMTIQETHAIDILDILFGAFKPLFGANWYPNQELTESMTNALATLIASPARKLYCKKNEEFWAIECAKFVQCVYGNNPETTSY